MSDYKIAICCITYNRKNSLERLLNSLNDVRYEKDIPLIISVDKSDSSEVEEFADSYCWRFGEKRVIKHKENLGLRKHVLSCGDLLEEYDALVVLEDDISVSPAFFQFTTECVEKYYNSPEIAGISLYSWNLNSHNFFPFIPIRTNSDVYRLQLAQSWGQVWMKNQWKEFIQWYQSPDSEFKETKHLPNSICHWSEKSWLKYHIKYCIEKRKYFIYPYVSLSTNHSECGTHNKKAMTDCQVPILMEFREKFILNPTVTYDAFFENEKIYEHLNMSKEFLCIDIYGNKDNKERKRYWLSTKRTGYKIINSFGIQYKPIEVNVLKDVPGTMIFLYDTSKGKRHFCLGGINIINYFYNYTSLLSHVKNIIKYMVGKDF